VLVLATRSPKPSRDQASRFPRDRHRHRYPQDLRIVACVGHTFWGSYRSQKHREPLELIHSDVIGATQTPSFGGKRYGILFTDDAMWYTKVYFMKTKLILGGGRQHRGVLKNSGHSPFEKWFGWKPDTKRIRTFGCLEYARNPDTLPPAKNLTIELPGRYWMAMEVLSGPAMIIQLKLSSRKRPSMGAEVPVARR
jgi:hypothetical protein